MTGIDINKRLPSLGQRGVIVVDGQDTTTASCGQGCDGHGRARYASYPKLRLWHTRVRDDPGLLWLRGLSESRLRAPDLDQDTRNRRRWPMISDHGSLISRMMQVCGRYR
jgi:hypothetical protein